MERTVRSTLRAIERAKSAQPDMIEIRFDLMKTEASVSAIRQATHLPLIATNRHRKEGGLFLGPEKARTHVLMQTAQEGFDYVDVELRTKGVDSLVRQLRHEGSEAIVSYHNMKTTPSLRALERVLGKQKAAGANVSKIVTHANGLLDNLPPLALVCKHARDERLVCFAMGESGVLSRVMSPILGAYFTYASAAVGRATAAGQVPVGRIKAIYRGLDIT